MILCRAIETIESIKQSGFVCSVVLSGLGAHVMLAWSINYVTPKGRGGGVKNGLFWCHVIYGQTRFALVAISLQTL